MRTNLAFQELTPRPELYLVPAPVDQAQTPELFINADNIPELSVERQKAAQEATRILARNRHLLHNGDAEHVPTPVDALGTARQAVAIKQRYGKNSPQYQEVFTGLVLDSERLLGEAYTKNTAEYFAKIKQNFDHSTGSYFSHGLSISTMVKNGLSPSTNSEEQGRRANEYVEEAGTYEPIGVMIGRVGLQGVIESLTVERDPKTASLSVMTISECTDHAIQNFKVNPKGSHGGYAPAVEKLMIRGVHYFDDSGDRHEEQVGLPGIYITHQLINEYLADRGVISQAQEPSKTEVHATQFISVNGTGVMSVVRDLDQLASKKRGKNLFMGEEVPEDHLKDYGDFVDEAEIRRTKLAPKPTQLANYLITLQENGTDPRVAMALVDRFLKATLLEVAGKNPELAEAMFDKATAEGFAEVARLDALGRTNDARLLEAVVKENAPEVSYCGAGSCGLDEVDPSSPAGQMAQRLGLKGKMLRNKEAACKNCNAKELHHDYNGNTVCTSCKSTKLNGKSVEHGKKEEKSGKKAQVISLDEKREKSKKAAAHKSAPLPERMGELRHLRSPQPQTRPSTV